MEGSWYAGIEGAGGRGDAGRQVGECVYPGGRCTGLMPSGCPPQALALSRHSSPKPYNTQPSNPQPLTTTYLCAQVGTSHSHKGT